jgi:hypothetical protein
MPDLFDSARAKLAWGRKHIRKLAQEIQVFLENSPCESFVELDPDNPERRLQKIRLARSIPQDFSLIAGDVVDNLRASLDHAIYAIAVTQTQTGIKYANFPFAGSASQFEEKLNGLKDIPKSFWPLLRHFRPYKEGNQTLISLNLACNRNKHALLVSFIGKAQITDVNVSGDGFISIPTSHSWDRIKNEMLLFSEGTETRRQGHLDFRFLIALTEIAEDEQAFTVLNIFADEVERILDAIQQEAYRLGLVQ